jgi:NTP pyrophosphatase (non-canonical NTP hydrolase)
MSLQRIGDLLRLHNDGYIEEDGLRELVPLLLQVNSSQAKELHETKKALAELSPEVQYWKGIFKIVEEAGELLDVLGKLGQFPKGIHPSEQDGEIILLEQLPEEIADVKATLDYFISANKLDAGAIEVRRLSKVKKFFNWGLKGVRK